MYRAGERKPYTPHLVLMGNVTVSGAEQQQPPTICQGKAGKQPGM